MNNHIILTPQQAELIRGRHGKYSAIDPVLTPDGNYIIPENCLNDSDLKSVKSQLDGMVNAENIQDIKDLKDTESLKKGTICMYEGGLTYCAEAESEMFAFEPESVGLPLTAKSILLDGFEVGKEGVKAKTEDADSNIIKLTGKVKNNVCDLTDGVRTSATDNHVRQLIADNNIIITNL
jgi:hypothetical protein